MVDTITAETLASRLASQDLILFDIRNQQDYDHEHIQFAQLLTIPGLDELVHLPKEAPLVLYCYHGISSLSVGRYIEQQGFISVAHLKGGYEAWKQHQAVDKS